MKLAGKVAVVTGGASGIGRAAVELFAEHGARVVVADVDARGEEVADAVVRAGHDATFIETDVSSAEQVERCITSTVERYGRLTTLFNNAAAISLVVHEDRSVTELPEHVWDRMLDVTLKGVYLCSKYAIPAIIAAGGGAVINTSSADAVIAQPGFDAYTAAKGGVLALTRSMAAEYGRLGVRVNAIVPGLVRTPATEPELADAAAVRAAERLHLTRIPQAGDIAKFALYLASDDAECVTGGWHRIDGGYASFKVAPEEDG